MVGQPLHDLLVVRVTDSRDRPVLGQRVEFRSIAGGDSSLLEPDTALTDSDGRAQSRWTLGDAAGAQTVRARVVSRVAGGSLSVLFSASAMPGSVDTIVAMKGQDQAAPVGATLADSLIAAVTDRFGNPLQGVTVMWSVPPGEGSVSATSTITGSSGRTGVQRTLGPGSGLQTATALVPSVNNVAVVFRHAALAGGAARLVLVSPDNLVGPAGSQLPDSMVVQAVDVDGNGVPGETITWEASDGGTAAPTSRVTDSQGKAYTFWTLPPAAGTSTLAASGFGNVVRFHATALPPTAPGYHLVFTVQPSNTPAGEKIQPPVKVSVLDQNDHVVLTDTVQVTVRLGNNPLGLGTLGGTTAKLTRDGVATFDDLKVTGITLLSDFTLIASAAGMADATSSSFSVSP